ncbi:MAG: hypothetical protein ACRDSR_06460 [Pseudonocardiaceae bacterium]
MDRDRRAQVAKTCFHAVGLGNLMLLLAAEPSTMTLGLAAVLAPFTLATALQLTAFLACNLIGLVLCGPRERAEFLVLAVRALQPPGAGERYQESMLAEIHAAPADQVQAIRTNLVVTAPRTVLTAWLHRPKPC